MKFKHYSALADFVILGLIWYYFLLVSDKHGVLFKEGPAENGIYVMASNFVEVIWGKLTKVHTLSDFINWLLVFFFHLSPPEFAEKPLFTTALGYFSLVYNILLPRSFINNPAGYFNIGCIFLSGWLLVRIFTRIGFILAGYICAILLFLNLTILLDALRGYHAPVGVLFSLLIIYALLKYCSSIAPPTTRQTISLGIGCSSLFFMSHHLIPTFVGLILIIFIVLWSKNPKYENRIKSTIMFSRGVILPFVYYGLRDCVIASGYLNAFYRPELAKYLAGFGRLRPYVYSAFFNSCIDALGQHLPRDFTFFYYMIIFIDGSFLFYAISVGIIIGLIFSFFVARTPRLKVNYSKHNIAIWLFWGTLSILAINLMVLAMVPLPYVSRAYTSAMLAFLSCGILGYSMTIASMRRRWRLLANIGLLFIVVIQLSHYNLFLENVRKVRGVDNKQGRVLFDISLHSPEDIIRYLTDLQMREGAEKVILLPLSEVVAHNHILISPIYCFFADLMKHGLKPLQKLDDGNPMRLVRLFTNEHSFYHLFKRLPTGSDRLAALIDVRLSKEFDYLKYYVFDLKEVMSIAQHLEWHQSMCSNLETKN